MCIRDRFKVTPLPALLIGRIRSVLRVSQKLNVLRTSKRRKAARHRRSEPYPRQSAGTYSEFLDGCPQIGLPESRLGVCGVRIRTFCASQCPTPRTLHFYSTAYRILDRSRAQIRPCTRQRLAHFYNARRASIARPKVSSSAYSRSPPTGKPLARRDVYKRQG